MLYTSVDGAREMRLLRLHSLSSSPNTSLVQASKDTPIHCDLYPITVREAKEQGYEVLSYSWGSPEDPLSIQVNGVEKSVTRNLHSALQHLREKENDVILWVDAICINQADDAEKSVQVNMMRDIYADGKCTKVWLGSAADNSNEIIAQLTEIGQIVLDRGAFEQFLKMTTLSIKDKAGAAAAEAEAKMLLEDVFDRRYTQLDASLRLLAQFQALLSRPYWSRVWILQEIVVSPNVDVYCGDRKIGFGILHAALLYIIYLRVYLTGELAKSLMAFLEAAGDGPFPDELKAQFDVVVAVEIPQSASLVAGMRLRYHDPDEESSGGKLHLFQLLARIRTGRESTDPRDRIWALLGMATDRGVLGIMPDYAQANACSAVYGNAARALISVGHVDILAFSQWTKKDPTTPSWVPDWREEVKLPHGQLPWDTPYSTAGTTSHLGNLEQMVSTSQLILKGYPIDSIESLKPQCNNGNFLSMRDQHEACKYLQDIMTLCQLSNEKLALAGGVEIYPNPADRERAYQRVPVADLYSTGLVRRASVDECHLGHAEVISDYQEVQIHGPDAAAAVTNTLRSYYIMMGAQVERRPFVTGKGYVGLAPKHAEAGDVVVVFPGAKFPYLVRRCEDGLYLLVGEVFVHGIMYGELMSVDREMVEFVLK